jgi:UDP-3-O-[3-hydroxymyristoyl] glucosamine N-acyltransferase
MKRTAREIADAVGAQLEGDASLVLEGVAAPEVAAPSDLIYVASAKYLPRAAASRAGCVVLPAGLTLAGRTVLRAENPKLVFARAAALLVDERAIAEGMHSTAVVSTQARLGAGVSVGAFTVIEVGVEIGAGTQIGAGCFIGRGVRIGQQCRLNPRVTLYAGARLGERVILHSGVVIGSDGFGYVRTAEGSAKFPQVGGVEIADDVEIGANSCVDRGSLGTTRIGRGVKIDNLVQVGHNVEIGEHTIIAAQTGISGSCRIGKNVLIGGQVGIADGCTIEDGAVLGAQAGIPTGKTIRAGLTVWGTPARPLDKFKQQYGWLSRQAARSRRGTDSGES